MRAAAADEFIKHSDGGVSEQTGTGLRPRGQFIKHSDGGVSEL